MKVILLDTLTLETKKVDDINTFNWHEHNWSCDCNRMSYFTDEEDDSNTCLGCHRYLVIAAEHFISNPEYANLDYPATVKELNEGYPDDLLKKFGLI